MKSLLISTFILSLSPFVQAGHFVSGGMPGALQCSDAQNIYNIKIVYLGSEVGLSGTQADNEGETSLNYECQARHEAVPSAVATELSFDCQSQNSKESIQVYRNLNTRAFWAVALKPTVNGVLAPTVLNCAKSSL